MLENKDTYCVYKHTSPSGKVYIGITSREPTIRWRNGKGYELCTAFNRAIEKYGWENIRHEILYESLDKETACAKEQELIAEHRSNEPEYGYNLTSGGEHYEANAEWRERLSKSLKKYYEEHPEKREKIGNDHRGKRLTEEHKRKVGEGMKRYYELHPECRAKCGDGVRGKKRGAEFSRKLGERKSKQVRCIETQIVYKSIKEAGEALGTHYMGITNQLHGRAKTCKGLTFEYVI